jgi:hypothetical protein
MWFCLGLLDQLASRSKLSLCSLRDINEPPRRLPVGYNQKGMITLMYRVEISQRVSSHFSRGNSRTRRSCMSTKDPTLSFMPPLFFSYLNHKGKGNNNVNTLLWSLVNCNYLCSWIRNLLSLIKG